MEKNSSKKTAADNGQSSELTRLQKLQNRVNKEKQRLKNIEKRNTEKLYVPVGRAVIEKSKSLNIENLTFEHASNLFEVGVIFHRFFEKLNADGKEQMIKSLRAKSLHAPESLFEFLNAKAQDFKLEPDKSEEIPY